MMTVSDRFWSKVDLGPECWLWTAFLDRYGYGQFESKRAHRFAYESLVGPIPEGLTVDHLCRNRACVNPAHLEPVPQGENMLRGDSPWAQNARKTHCVHGHSLADCYVQSGKRICRTCKAEKNRRYQARLRAS